MDSIPLSQKAITLIYHDCLHEVYMIICIRKVLNSIPQLGHSVEITVLKCGGFTYVQHNYVLAVQGEDGEEKSNAHNLKIM